ncbi:MAG: Hpt domain-containing protein [Candidatus Kariarchaeaceae archaeon]|jgi:chemotaxis protein histidine kinase CheA
MAYLHNSSETTSEDEAFKEEMMRVFMHEFEELMTIFEHALKELRRPSGDIKHAYKEIFRVFHTLKGDSGFFEGYEGFTQYASELCEVYRDLPNDQLSNPKLLQIARINFSRLSSTINALNKGKSLKAFRFKVFLRNF